MTGHVFISYVREDSDLVDYIASLFRANNVSYWLDREDLRPGSRWKPALKDAIQKGAYFLLVGSANLTRRERSTVYEELLIAVEE